MLFKTIRSQIALYLCFLLFSGMILIGLTAMLSFQSLVASYASKDFFLRFDTLSYEINNFISKDKYSQKSLMPEILMLMKNSMVCRLVYILDSSNKIHDYGSCSGAIDDFKLIIDAADKSSDVYSKLISTGLNMPFFSKGHRYFIIYGPLKSESGLRNGSLIVVYNFDAEFMGMDRLEKLLFVYILINTLVLVAVGVYQIGNITAKPMKKILRRTESAFNDDFYIAKKNGSDFDQLSSSIGFLVDDLSLNKKNLQATVTELEAANSNMKKMQNEIIRAEKMASIGRLSAGLAHEIGNPVGIISGYLEMLKQSEIDDSERIDFASRADDELNRIDSIIRSLLDYARPHDQEKTELSVHQLINDIVRAYAGSRAIGNIDLKTDLNADFDCVIANSDKLRQVFMNLIINASDAIFDSENRDKGQLKISTMNLLKEENNHSDIIISFVDNGCGLSENDFENVFDPFFTTKPQGKGTGLGLSVSLMIIEDIAGSIKALPCDGGGTEFRITLPLTKGA